MTEKQKQERWDFVDNAIFKLMRELNPAATEIYWDAQAIFEVRYAIQSHLVEDLQLCTDEEFYPYTEEEGKEF